MPKSEMPLEKADAGPVSAGLKPVLSLTALVLFGLAFVGPTAPYTFFGVGAELSHGQFALVYLIAMVAVSFTAASYGKMAASYPEAGSAYVYASRAIHPVVGHLTGWAMILDYLLMPMLCVIIVGSTCNKLFPLIPYSVWVILTSVTITLINIRGIQTTSRATTLFNIVLAISIGWFLVAAALALFHGAGSGKIFSLAPFYNPQDFSWTRIMHATPVAVLSFLGFDGISTLAEDSVNPEKNVARATIMVCVIAGTLFIVQTYLGQLLWPDYKSFPSLETAFSDIGKMIGGAGLYYLIVYLVVAQAIASGLASQASASRLLYGMAREGRLPHALFGRLHRTRQTPVISILIMGAIAMALGLALDLDKAAQLVNFGACVGFMAVNLSVLVSYFSGKKTRGGVWSNAISPAIGFLICLWIWSSVSALAMKLGLVWTAVGVAYLLASARSRKINMRNASAS